MPEHFLLKNTIPLPDDALIRSTKLSEDSLYLTKSAGAPGDNDDPHSAVNILNGWNNTFLTKTCAAPGDDDDYHSAMNIISGWNNSFFTKINVSAKDDEEII